MADTDVIPKTLTVERFIFILRSYATDDELAAAIEAKVRELRTVLVEQPLYGHAVSTGEAPAGTPPGIDAVAVLSSKYSVEEAPALEAAASSGDGGGNAPAASVASVQPMRPRKKSRRLDRNTRTVTRSYDVEEDDTDEMAQATERQVTKAVIDLSSRPLLLMQKLSDFPSLSGVDKRSVMTALWTSLRDPFEGLSDRELVELRSNPTLFSDIYEWTKSPDFSRGQTFSSLGKLMSSATGISIALAIADSMQPKSSPLQPQENAAVLPSASSSQMHSTRSSGTVYDIVKAALRSKGFEMEEVVKSRSDFYRASAAGRLLREFPGLQQIGIHSVVTLGERSSHVRETILTTPWLACLLKAPIPRPTAGSAFVDASRTSVPFASCTSMLQDLWEAQEIDGVERYFGRCIFCMTNDAHTCNVECFPGICAVCMNEVYGVKIVFCGDVKGRGIAATRHIARESDLFEYEGELLSADQVRTTYGEISHLSAPYVALVSDKTAESPLQVYVDASRYRGIAAFLNHNAENPNCELRRIRGRLWIRTIDDIEPGEELTYSYGDVHFPRSEKASDTGGGGSIDVLLPPALIKPEERVHSR